MNIFFRIGKILFQLIASILIILALILEHLSKTKQLKTTIKKTPREYNKILPPKTAKAIS